MYSIGHIECLILKGQCLTVLLEYSVIYANSNAGSNQDFYKRISKIYVYYIHDFRAFDFCIKRSKCFRFKARAHAQIKR